MNKPNYFRRRAAASFLCYSVDLGMGLTAYVIGFGLTVQNWPVLIGLGIFSRWVFHLVNSAVMFADARERAEGGEA